jgi:polyferredoxin
MAKTRNILYKLEVRASKRANKCRRNRKHEIPKGDLWLIVTPPGAASRDYGYCIDCGTAILEGAQVCLAEQLAALRPALVSN